MRISRARRRNRFVLQGSQSMAAMAWWLLPIAMLALATSVYLGQTHAIGSGGTGASTGLLSAMESSRSLEMTPGEADLGQLIVGEGATWPGVLTVRNTADRPLDLRATVTGVSGLKARVDPATLQPGEIASIELSGAATEPGEFSGTVRIEAFGGFLSAEIPIKGIAVRPEPRCVCTCRRVCAIERETEQMAEAPAQSEEEMCPQDTCRDVQCPEGSAAIPCAGEDCEAKAQAECPITQTGLPDEVEEPPPGKAGEAPPDKVEEAPPDKAEEAPPDKAEEAPPDVAEEAPPGKPEEPPPGGAEEPSPGKAEEPPPGKAEEPSPGKAEEPPLGKAEEPSPGKAEEAPPDKAEEPPPGKTEEPPPGKAEELPPGKAEEPPPAEPEGISPTNPPDGSESI